MAKFMRDRWKTWAVCVALALGTLLLYSPSLTFDFINWDDSTYITTNDQLQGGLCWHGLVWSLQTSYGGHWLPLLWLSYMLDYQLHGLNPAGYHAFNFLLHAANAVLLFLILKGMTGTFWRSGMVAALFAWHPTHVESVAWIAERKDVLSTLFWMLTMLAYLNYARKGGAARYALVLILFGLGLMAKPMLVTLPFVLLLLDWWPLRRLQTAASPAPSAKPVRRLLLEKTPLFLMAAACSVLTAMLQKRAGAVSSLAAVPMAARLVNALVSYAQYIEKTIWPVGLYAIYPLQRMWQWREVVGALVCLGGISVLVIRLRRSSPYLLVGWLWFLGALVPVIGLVQVGIQAMADRYTYIPSIGLYIMICWGAYDWLRFASVTLNSKIIDSQWVAGGLGFAVVAASAIVTNRQLQYWADSGTVFSRALAAGPDNRVARASLGLFFYQQKRYPEAIRTLREDLQAFPGDPLGHAFLGEVYSSTGKADAAAAEFRAALRLRPGLVTARKGLISILLQKRLSGEAAAECAIALKYDPDNARLHCAMGEALLLQGRLDEAAAQLAEALRLYPQFAEAHYQLATVLSNQHKTAEAIAQYQAALALEPSMPDALNNLAWILATDSNARIRNGGEAVRLARRACALTRNRLPLLLGTLAAAYAENAQFDEAIASAQQAHDLAVAKGLDKVAAKNAELMELYRSGRAYRE
jgi:Tfp pilus assembly protein PilF